MPEVAYGDGQNTTAEELTEFYARLRHPIHAAPAHVQRMMANSAVFVTARVDGGLIGVARGVCDGLRGYLTECKLDPAYQGPAAITRTDGRIEHDLHGIAAEMAKRVLRKMFEDGVCRVDVLAWGTEVDFVEELGFKRPGGLVGLTLVAEEWSGQAGSA
ncbi:MAG: hypothetical protein JXO22_01040 [Phycisphaerae bacterium]|nr:hypothetical protein [Phycisphaerae bacterium]